MARQTISGDAAVFSTLAFSTNAPVSCSMLTCHSLFKQAINLQDGNSRLLTLHRSGSGISPMGWLLRAADFDTISARLYPGAILSLTDQGLRGDRFFLRKNRAVCLKAPAYNTLTSPVPFLHDCFYPTGLSGPLNRAVNDVQNGPGRILYDGLTDWQRDKPVAWQGLIGLGPGLTPSGDDMLVGALAALYCDKGMRTKLYRQPALDHTLPLTQLTTTVSSCYLKQAGKGYFSLSLLHVVSSLARRRNVAKAITRLLNHGHTSGADTLLGLSLGVRWLNDINRGVLQYA